MKKKTKILTVLISACALFVCGGCITVFAAGDVGAADANVFEEIFEALKAYSSEILSALAFIGSLILSIAYKSGMMPTLKRGISSIGTAVSDIRDVSDSSKRAQDAFTEKISERLEKTESALSKIEEMLENAKVDLENLCTEAAEHEKINAVIGEQVSLLYDVFMFSSMPEYQKDAVGRRVEKMRRLIGEKTEADEI